MKKDIIHSAIVLLTIVNGIIATFSLGMTELIKYLLKDPAQVPEMKVKIDELMLGSISLSGVSLKDNLGWGFLALMLLGLIIIVAMNNNTKFNADHK